MFAGSASSLKRTRVPSRRHHGDSPTSRASGTDHCRSRAASGSSSLRVLRSGLETRRRSSGSPGVDDARIWRSSPIEAVFSTVSSVCVGSAAQSDGSHRCTRMTSCESDVLVSAVMS
eukprot:Amastigsp_a680213_27.p4 type:complete len:117 gc:universal Amastigsp_a680213_27:678-328(-)